MLQKTTIDFLKNLKKNNNKEWFDKNRPQFDEAKEDFLQVIASALQHLVSIDKNYGDLKPKDCLFRQHRDVRFSKDKSPYKTNMGAAFHLGGKKSGNAAFYFHLEPGNSFIGGGIWMPETDKLKMVRQEIDYNFDDFKKVVNQKGFVSMFGMLNEEDKLKTPPKGYDINNPAIEYLKLKSFTVGKPITDSELLSKNLSSDIKKIFTSMAPFIAFLNKAIAH